MQESGKIKFSPIQPYLILFLSVDVVGSTAFKSKSTIKRNKEQPEQPWIQVFKDFYQEFKSFIRLQPEQLNKLTEWKSLGDELLFYYIIEKQEEVISVLAGFDQAIQDYRKTNTFINFGLSLKGTAWLAGFPVVNAILSNPVADFIGPSIDAGFRISKYASPNRLCISLELAYILCDLFTSHNSGVLPIGSAAFARLKDRLFLYGNESLKGVIRDIPYPIFYIDQSSDSEAKFNNLKCIEKIKSESALEYLKAFIREYNSPETLCAPYIKSSTGEISYGEEPELHKFLFTELLRKNELSPFPRTEGEEPISSTEQILDEEKILKDIMTNQV